MRIVELERKTISVITVLLQRIQGGIQRTVRIICVLGTLFWFEPSVPSRVSNQQRPPASDAAT
jgi:hypothetical protein